MINYINGDATDPTGDGNKFIIHICNDVCAWGAGFVLAVSKRWPEPEARFKGVVLSLGDVQITKVENDVWVCNMVAQSGLRSRSNSVPLDLTALKECLTKVEVAASSQNASIHMPRIGCGLAGGKWEDVEPIVSSSLHRKTYVYDFE